MSSLPVGLIIALRKNEPFQESSWGPEPMWGATSISFLLTVFFQLAEALLQGSGLSVGVSAAWSSWGGEGWEGAGPVAVATRGCDHEPISFPADFGMNQSLLLTHLLSPPSSSLPTPFCHLPSSPLNLRLSSDLFFFFFFSTPGYSSIATEATHGRLLLFFSLDH